MFNSDSEWHAVIFLNVFTDQNVNFSEFQGILWSSNCPKCASGFFARENITQEKVCRCVRDQKTRMCAWSCIKSFLYTWNSTLGTKAIICNILPVYRTSDWNPKLLPVSDPVSSTYKSEEFNILCYIECRRRKGKYRNVTVTKRILSVIVAPKYVTNYSLWVRVFFFHSKVGEDS